MIAFLRDLLFKDLWLKLFSFVLAVLIWFIVNIAVTNELPPGAMAIRAGVEEKTLTIPVVVVSSANDGRAFAISPAQVQVTVQGKARLLNQLQEKDVRAVVDVTGIRATGNFHKRIEVYTPNDIMCSKISPDQAQISFPLQSGAPN